MYSVLSAFTWKTMPPAVCSRSCSRDSAWIGVFTRSTMPSACYIIAEGFFFILSIFVLYILSFGLVRLTFLLSAWVS